MIVSEFFYNKIKPNIEGMNLEQICNEMGANSNEFFVKIEGFIKFIVQRYYFYRTDIEDLISDCYARVIGTLKERPFDKKVGCTFDSYIFSIIRNEITRYVYRQDRNNRLGCGEEALVNEHVEKEELDIDFYKKFIETLKTVFPVTEEIVNKILEEVKDVSYGSKIYVNPLTKMIIWRIYYANNSANR